MGFFDWLKEITSTEEDYDKFIEKDDEEKEQEFNKKLEDAAKQAEEKERQEIKAQLKLKLEMLKSQYRDDRAGIILEIKNGIKDDNPDNAIDLIKKYAEVAQDDEEFIIWANKAKEMKKQKIDLSVLKARYECTSNTDYHARIKILQNLLKLEPKDEYNIDLLKCNYAVTQYEEYPMRIHLLKSLVEILSRNNSNELPEYKQKLKKCEKEYKQKLKTENKNNLLIKKDELNTAVKYSILLFSGALIVLIVVIILYVLSDDNNVRADAQATAENPDKSIPVDIKTDPDVISDSTVWGFFSKSECKFSKSGTTLSVYGTNASNASIEISGISMNECKTVDIAFDNQTPKSVKCSLNEGKIKIESNRRMIKNMRGSANMKVTLPLDNGDGKIIQYSLAGFSKACEWTK